MLLARADDARSPTPICEPLLSGLVRAFDGDRAVRAFAAVDRALAALDRNASPKIVADWVAFQTVDTSARRLGRLHREPT